jgi:hypothetical protein
MRGAKVARRVEEEIMKKPTDRFHVELELGSLETDIAARETLVNNVQKNASDFRNMLAGLNLGRIELHAVA